LESTPGKRPEILVSGFGSLVCDGKERCARNYPMWVEIFLHLSQACVIVSCRRFRTRTCSPP